MKTIILLAVSLAITSAFNLKDVKPIYEFPQFWVSHGMTPPPESFGRTGRIVGGEIAGKGQFPYQAGLFLQTEGGVGFCGGSIISKRTILTAAHCTDDVINGTVVLAAQNIKEDEPQQIKYEITSKNFVVHSDWNRSNLRNDLALIILNEDIPLNENLKIINLAPASSDNFEGTLATVSGWGKTSDEANGISSELRFTQDKIISNLRCTVRFFGRITMKQICLNGDAKRSSCNGDSGGPLVEGEGEELQQIGVVSFGSGAGCEAGFPSVYTRISSYIDWIDSNKV